MKEFGLKIGRLYNILAHDEKNSVDFSQLGLLWNNDRSERRFLGTKISMFSLNIVEEKRLTSLFNNNIIILSSVSQSNDSIYIVLLLLMLCV